MRFFTCARLYGNNILIRGFDDDKGNFTEKIEYQPTLFVSSKKETKFKSLKGEYVAPVKPGTIKDCKDYIQEYSNIPGFEVFGMDRFLYQYIADEYPGEISYDMNRIKMWSLDIETTSENGFPKPELAEEEVLLITMKNFFTKEILTFGSKPYVGNAETKYIECEDEYSLLLTFLAFWKKEQPEVITGWNVNLFDITYLCKRIINLFSEKELNSLSPWGYVYEDYELYNGERKLKYNIIGVNVIDYLTLYKKFTFTNRESYRLDAIAEIELGEKKLSHSQFDTFKEFYTKDWNLFVEYNIHDVNLVDKMEEKMKLISLIMLMAYDAKCNYEDTFYQVRFWDIIIYNYLRKKNIVIPLKKSSDKSEQFSGAYVKEPIPGSYDWVVSYDLASLYPSLIRFLNISPETLTNNKIDVDVDSLVNKKLELKSDCAIAANGCLYSKEKTGFMPELVKKFYDERVIYKNKMIDCQKEYEKNPSKELEREITKWQNFQMARKISLNSLYGALGNQYFRHFLVDNALAVTVTGQVAIRWIGRKINEYLNIILKTNKVDYVIASDTDSIYLNLGPLVSTILPKDGKQKSEIELSRNRIVEILNIFCENKITPFIDESYNELSDYLNCYEKCLVMKREVIADRGIWTAKKRYILNVWDNEGVRYNEPKLKMMGIEAVKSSTPAAIRTYIKDGIKIILNGTEDDLIKFIEDKRVEFITLPPEDIAFPRSANKITYYQTGNGEYKSATPIAVRGSILFNHLLNLNNITNKYNSIANGEKVKFVYLKIPNPIHENIISFINILPPEFKLHQYVDYDLTFDKGFIAPMESILHPIGWKSEPTNTLDSFFL